MLVLGVLLNAFGFGGFELVFIGVITAIGCCLYCLLVIMAGCA